MPLMLDPHPAVAAGTCSKMNGIDVCGRFLEEWSKQGTNQSGVYVNGFPITPQRAEISLTDGKTYSTQWFERARYEAHPENSPPYDVLLGALGVSLAEGREAADPATGKARQAIDQPFVGIPRPSGPNSAGTRWFIETRHSVSGKILQYWNQYGGLQQFGFPLSEQFQEVSPTDGKTYTVQYFERNRFELHPEKAAPYEVELGLLGVQQYNQQAVPAGSLPTAPPPLIASSKDTATIGLPQEPGALLGWSQTARVALPVLDALDDTLVAQTASGDLYPEDAAYVPTLENGGSYFVGSGDDRHLVTKYKIRPGVKWSDGKELTAQDAVFAQTLITDPSSSATMRNHHLMLLSVDAANKYTAVYNWLSYNAALDLYNKVVDKAEVAFLKPYLDAHSPVAPPDYATIGAIYPQHALNAILPSAIAASAYAREGHIGTGPFRIEKWLPSEEIDLVRNDSYTLTAPPLLKRVVMKFVADSSQMAALLRSGTLDGVTAGAFSVPSAELDQLATVAQVDFVPSATWERIDFDLTDPALQDRAVREAIISAVNRPKIAADNLRSHGLVLNTVAPPSNPFSLQNSVAAKQLAGKVTLAQYEYNPDHANSLLDAAGWQMGPEGVRGKGEIPLQFDYVYYSGSRVRDSIAKQVEDDLKAVGIEVDAHSVPQNCRGCAPQPCQLCAYSSTTPAQPDFSEWSTHAPEAGDAGRTRLLAHRNYSSPQLDPLIAAYSTAGGREEQLVAAGAIQAGLMLDVALIPLYPQLNIEAHAQNLVNWHTSSGLVTPLYNVAQWYFK